MLAWGGEGASMRVGPWRRAGAGTRGGRRAAPPATAPGALARRPLASWGVLAGGPLAWESCLGSHCWGRQPGQPEGRRALGTCECASALELPGGLGPLSHPATPIATTRPHPLTACPQNAANRGRRVHLRTADEAQQGDMLICCVGTSDAGQTGAERAKEPGTVVGPMGPAARKGRLSRPAGVRHRYSLNISSGTCGALRCGVRAAGYGPVEGHNDPPRAPQVLSRPAPRS